MKHKEHLHLIIKDFMIKLNHNLSILDVKDEDDTIREFNESTRDLMASTWETFELTLNKKNYKKLMKSIKQFDEGKGFHKELIDECELCKQHGRTPNAETQAAIEEAEKGNTIKFKTLDQMIKYLEGAEQQWYKDSDFLVEKRTFKKK